MVNDSNEDKKKPLNLKREALIAISRQASDFREAKIKSASSVKEADFWESQTINSIILKYFYDTDGATEFNTFHQWKEKGATIIKGEKAFAIWGQPLYPSTRTDQQQPGVESQSETTSEQEQERRYRLWPMCFLFSDRQVILPEDRIPVRVDPEEVEEQEREEITLDSFM